MPAKNASLGVNMDAEKRTEIIHELDVKYRRASYQSDLLVKDEDARRLKLRGVLLRDQNSTLKEHVSQRDARIKALAEQTEDVRSQLASAQEKCRRQEKLMQSQTREISNLREELSAVSTMSQDSAKLLSEKLALSRELALLKPELEHLRSQLAHQSDVLAEKLALQRQLNSLEVELANEKRAAQKASQKQDQDNQQEDELRTQVRELEKQLAKEKRTVQKQIQDQESRNSTVEEELESLREQLATAEENLTAERRKAEKLAKAKNSASTETAEELEQLRQRLTTAEKAVADEKRAAQRAAKNQASGASAAQDDLDNLREELANALEALALEKKESKRLQQENQQALAQAEERQQLSDQRIEKLRSKLLTMREELKKCQADLEKAQERTVKLPSVKVAALPLKKTGAKPGRKKRNSDEMSTDHKMLQTPGTVDNRPKRPLKKRGFDPSIVGEKSTFSITPFLNKTANLSDGSPDGREEEADVSVLASKAAVKATPAVEPETEKADEASEPSEAQPAVASVQEKKPRGRPRMKPLAESGPSKQNLTTAARARKPPRVSPTLAQVAEEPDEVAEEQENRSVETTAKGLELKVTKSADTSRSSTSSVTAAIAGEPEPKKKKRKLLGANQSTLFDDDEGERVTAMPAVGAVKRAPKAAIGGAAGLRVMGKTGLAGGAGKKNPFAGAAFSPLKRDRRGVGASFLA